MTFSTGCVNYGDGGREEDYLDLNVRSLEQRQRSFWASFDEVIAETEGVSSYSPPLFGDRRAS
jgi:hypothetical protein